MKKIYLGLFACAVITLLVLSLLVSPDTIEEEENQQDAVVYGAMLSTSDYDPEDPILSTLKEYSLKDQLDDKKDSLGDRILDGKGSVSGYVIKSLDEGMDGGGDAAAYPTFPIGGANAQGYLRYDYIPNSIVLLFNEESGLVNATFTDADGYYEFTGMENGEYGIIALDAAIQLSGNIAVISFDPLGSPDLGHIFYLGIDLEAEGAGCEDLEISGEGQVELDIELMGVEYNYEKTSEFLPEYFERPDPLVSY